MEHLRFKGRIRKVGGSWVVTIPHDFVKHGNINPEKECEFEINEV